MISIQNSLAELKQLDLLGRGDTYLHRLDARAKVLVTFVFILCVVSYDRYELSALLPYFIFPAVMIALGALPPVFFAKKIALLLPFIAVIGVFNPLLDREVVLQIGILGISAGWISFLSILIRAVLTVGTAFILIGITGFNAVCHALEKLGVPQIFAVQLMFLYRYIFVLTEEAGRVSRARDLRSCGRKGLGLNSFSSLVGHLLLRTWQQAERIHRAMLARGFNGEFHTHTPDRFRRADFCFVLGWTTLFIFMRAGNFSHFIGRLVTP